MDRGAGRVEELLKIIRRSRAHKIALLLALPIGYLMVFFVAPFILTLFYSFDLIDAARRFTGIPSLEHYEWVFLNEGVWRIFARSLIYAGFTTTASLMIGYPVAYYIAFKVKRHKDTLLLLFIIPFWVSFLLRTYALMSILSPEGVVNAFLTNIGLIDQPLNLLYNQQAVIIGMIYNYLPFMILPLFSNIEKLSRSYLEAAATLGAGPVSTFLRITLPQTMPGIAAGSLLVFVLSTGEFIVPSLLGSTDTFVIGNVVYEMFLRARSWWIGSALSLIFIGFILAVAIIYIRLVGAKLTVM